jgi:hypothetical protein
MKKILLTTTMLLLVGFMWSQANVTFRVNMVGVSGFTTPEVNGTFNGWCGGCFQLTDVNLDGVWEGTTFLSAGTYEYKFAYDSWSGQESLVPGTPCTVTNSGFTNRLLVVDSADVILPIVCYGSCEICTIGYGISCQDLPNEPTGISAQVVTIGSVTEGACDDYVFVPSFSPASTGWEYQWLKNGVPVNGATNESFNAVRSVVQDDVYSFIATCPVNGQTITSSGFNVAACYNGNSSSLNYLLVQNVTTTGNIPGQSIQVQYDLNWGNTWKDDVNWDAVWVFMKYKDANGVWKHAKVSPTGYNNGQGTPNLIEPAADQMGAFVRLALEGQGNFNAEGMQLRWNYGADGLSSVSGLEVRVYAIEMVYTPQGDFSVTNGPAPGGKTPVINTRLSPPMNLWGTMRVKGDAGLDTDANGSVDNTIYPTGYYPFYMFKYEMSDQQYADFLNCMTPAQRTALGWGGTITETAGQYFAAAPNRACDFSNTQRLLAYSDWAGLRPLSYLEFEKGFHGPKPPQNPDGGRVCCGDASGNSGSGVYGAKDMTGNVREPIVIMTSNTFDRNIHGNGILSASGPSDVSSWSSLVIDWLGYGPWWWESEGRLGFRLCRSAE